MIIRLTSAVQQLYLESDQPITSQQILAWSKLKEYTDNNFDMAKKVQFLFDKLKNNVSKRRKWWLPAFAPFRKMFQKGFSPRVVKSWGFSV